MTANTAGTNHHFKFIIYLLYHCNMRREVQDRVTNMFSSFCSMTDNIGAIRTEKHEKAPENVIHLDTNDRKVA